MSFQSDNFDETFLTVAEVAELLKLNQQTVRNWIDQGKMPALRVGRRVRIRRSDFERVLEESSIPGASRPTDAGPTAEDFWGGEPIGVAEAAVPPAEAARAQVGAVDTRAEAANTPPAEVPDAGAAAGPGPADSSLNDTTSPAPVGDRVP